jgi:hypothetical protein
MDHPTCPETVPLAVVYRVATRCLAMAWRTVSTSNESELSNQLDEIEKIVQNELARIGPD